MPWIGDFLKKSVTGRSPREPGSSAAQTALRLQLEELAADSPDASVVVQADASVEHGRVVDTMDTIKQAGFTRIAIATRSDE